MFLLDYFHYLMNFFTHKTCINKLLLETNSINENRSKKSNKINKTRPIYNPLMTILLEHCSIGI